MSLKIKFHKKECHPKKNDLKKPHSKWNVNPNGMSPQMEFHLKLNVTQNGMSFKVECH